jgi:hypothetical protein
MILNPCICKGGGYKIEGENVKLARENSQVRFEGEGT